MNAGSTLRLHSGREMPVFGLGTWQLTKATADTVDYALHHGYAMIDTAVDYGSQRGIGDALGRASIDREAVFLVAKVEEDEDAFEATGRYLDEMQQDHADLMLIHRPPNEGVGEELWRGLIRAREAGLTLDIGVSNYSTQQIDRLVESTGEMPVVNQIEWSPFGWSAEMLDYCREHEIVIQGYSPLTRGERLGDERLGRLAAEYERTPAQLLLRWAIQKGVVPLPKANQKEHLDENLGAFEFDITDADMERLDSLNEHYSSLGPSPQYL